MDQFGATVGKLSKLKPLSIVITIIAILLATPGPFGPIGAAAAATAYDASSQTEYPQPLAAADPSWNEDDALLSGSSGFTAPFAANALIDFGPGGINASEVEITAGADGLDNDPYTLYGSNDGVTWTQIALPDGWASGSYTASISGSYRYFQFTFSDADGPWLTSLPQFDVIGPQTPPAPTNLTAAGGNSQIALNWTPSPGASSYNVYRGTSSGGESGSPIATGITSPSFVDSAASVGATYFYQVTAVDSAGESGRSNEASALATAAPPAPVNLTATSGDTLVALSWTASPSASSYNVYRGTTPGGEAPAPVATGVSAASFTDTSLSDGVMYYYTVTAVDTSGESAPSNEASATPEPQIPAAPANLSASPGNNQVTLAWTASSGAASYNVYAGAWPGGESSTPIASGITSTSFTDTGASNGYTYFYYVAAVNGGGESAPSNEADATPEPPVPPAPANLTAAAGNQQVSLSWTAPAGEVDSYNLYRSSTRGGEGAEPYQTGLSGTNYTDSNVSNGTTYYYEITAVNGGGESGLSNEASATPELAPPPAPTGLTAAGGYQQAALSWSAPWDATSYNIYRGTTSGGEGAAPIATGVTSTDYTDTGVAGGTTYYYVVTGINAAGEGPASNQASATPSSVPSAPTNLTAAAGDGQAVLSWTGTAGAVTYNIYRATSSGGEGSAPYQTGVASAGYTDTGLTDGTTYYYQVTAVGASGESGKSNQASATPYTPTAAPVGVAFPYDGYVWVDSSRNAGSLGFRLYRSTVPGGEGATPYQSWAIWSSYQDTSVVNGVMYYYQVSTVNTSGQESARSPEFTCVPNSATLPAPLATGFFDSSGNFDLNWNPVAGAVQYGVYDQNGLIALTSTTSALEEAGNENYHVVSIDQNGASTSNFGEVSSSVNNAPLAPIGLTAAGGNAQVALAWDPAQAGNSEGVVGYVLYRSTTSGGPYIQQNSALISTTSYIDSSVSNGTTYYYVVASVGGDYQQSPYSNEASATPYVTPPSLSAMPGDGSAVLAWTYAYPATFNLFRSTTSGGPYTCITPTPLTGSTYTDSGLANGTTYYYVATAIENGLSSGNSNQAAATPSSIPPVPTVAALAYPGEILLQWSPINNATGYYIYRSTTSGGPYTLTPIGGVSGLTTAYADDNLNDGTTYYYVIQTAFGTELTAYSAEVSATPAGAVLFDANPANVVAMRGANTAVSMDFLNPADFADTLAFSIAAPNPLPANSSAWFYPSVAVSTGSLLNLLLSAGATPGSIPVILQGYAPTTQATYVKVLVINSQ